MSMPSEGVVQTSTVLPLVLGPVPASPHIHVALDRAPMN